MVDYKPVEITIDVQELIEIIIDIIVRYHDLLDAIIIDQNFLFTSKFWILLCYFLKIKRILSMAFHPQINSQTKKQNSTIEAYLRAFVNWE